MYEAELNERANRIEWPLIVAAVGLLIIGVLFISSVCAAQDVSDWYKELYVRQIAFCVVGIAAVAALCMFDYVTLARWSIVIYWLSIIFLICVPIFGTTMLGAKRWIDVGLGFRLQPSEFAKVGFIIALANYLSRPIEELRNPATIWKAIGMTVLPFLLILKEPDMGSALVFLPVCLMMMFVAGVSQKFLAKLTGAACLFAVIIVIAGAFAPPRFTPFIKDYQRDRLKTYFGQRVLPKNATPAERARHRAKSYNAEQALISVGSGGFTGKGWRQGTQHSLGFLPSAGAHNDFIFSVIAEEEGFMGSVVILTLYTVLLFSGIKIASQARDRLGKLMAVGVVTLLFCHIFINIGMNISILPVTGIPLPLLSYGGSSVVCSLIAIGILHNIHSYRRSY